jgi:hypothetical protein
MDETNVVGIYNGIEFDCVETSVLDDPMLDIEDGTVDGMIRELEKPSLVPELMIDKELEIALREDEVASIPLERTLVLLVEVCPLPTLVVKSEDVSLDEILVELDVVDKCAVGDVSKIKHFRSKREQAQPPPVSKTAKIVSVQSSALLFICKTYTENVHCHLYRKSHHCCSSRRCRIGRRNSSPCSGLAQNNRAVALREWRHRVELR